MAYYQEFVKRLSEQDLPRVLQLWEEYVSGDQVDVPEFTEILEAIKNSEIAGRFGSHVEIALPYWNLIQDKGESYEVLRHLIDLQTTHSPLLLDVTLNAIRTRYPNDPQFDQRIRLVNLRGVGSFQGALSHYDLLAHLAKGKFVFHTGGWGTGEVVEISSVRQEITCEFELVRGNRQISFQNAFKMLKPLPDTHFLSRRFGNPDKLEEEARQDPVKVIRMLLTDLGPKSAQEIKDELAEWVIPESEWAKWWQNARSKLKKDTLIESPINLKDPFYIRTNVVEHDEKFLAQLQKAKSFQESLTFSYNFVRDFPALGKKEAVLEAMRRELGRFPFQELTPAEKLEKLLFLEGFLGDRALLPELKALIDSMPSLLAVMEDIPILALKKRLLVVIRAENPHWQDQFLHLLLVLPQNPLKEFIYEELAKEKNVAKLEHRIEHLLNHPKESPEAFFWYFQKILSDPKALYADKEGQLEFFEALFVLLHKIENEPESKELVKKIYQLIIADRYKLVRTLLEGSPLAFAKELLLLVTKCRTLTDHDIKIVKSLVEVAHPNLAEGRVEEVVLWTTEAGFERTRARVQEIGTVEIVENAREVEAARALGDLRENSEYKFALEKRARLQSELKFLSDQLKEARILTKADVLSNEVGVGSVVTLKNGLGESVTYTLLGPWDADPDKHILSYQSKLAEAMMGLKVGASFTFRHDTYTITGIKSFFS